MTTLLPQDFHPVVQRWWASRFAEPTAAQAEGWSAIRRGEHTLIAAPTGSGKTLAAFLTSIDELFREGTDNGGLPDEVRVIYVSPLKALSADIHKNLAEPRRELRAHARAPRPHLRAEAATDWLVRDPEADRGSRALSHARAVRDRRPGPQAQDGSRGGSPGIAARSGDVARSLAGDLRPARG